MRLVAQRNHALVALAEGGNALEPAIRLRKHSDGTVAINRVPIIGKVPAAALPGRALRYVRIHGQFRRREAVRAGKRNRQQ